MEIPVTYRINRVSRHKHTVPVVAPGETQPEPMDRHQVEVELQDETGGHGSLTLRFYGTAARAALAGFVSGADYILMVQIPDPPVVTPVAEPEAA